MMHGIYVKRKIDSVLQAWKASARRKPVLLRGARQVGKSSSVRELAKQFDYFVEVNFDGDAQERGVNAVFEKGLSPQRICEELSAIYSTPVAAGRTLLFLDEIQACIPAISSLRYFYEQHPELHVVAAGSLLEFALEALPSFGVGRVRSLFMHPFSFDEYLRAMGHEILADAVLKATPDNPYSEALHRQCVQHLQRFILVGGMPEVVATYAGGGSLLDCQAVLDDLTLALYADFAKYKARVPASRLREVFASVMRQTGGKFIYSNASQASNHLQVKESVELLELAGLIYPVTHTSANGIPLAAEQNVKFRKYLIFDTGIFQRFLQLDISKILLADSFQQVNKGGIAELFVGLELLKAAPANNTSQLYYWQREQRGSSAEVDYVVQRRDKVVPVEVKSGTQGSMQSLHLFMQEKESEYGIRTSLENFAQYGKIKVYPLYAAGNIVQGQ
jgi:predicted AAA+ superfamily ATPase